MENNYPFKPKDYELGTMEQFMKGYAKEDKSKFYNAFVSINNVLLRYNSQFKRLEVLTVLRSKQPFKDCYSLIGGFMRGNETTQEALEKITWNSTGIDLISYPTYPVGIYDDPRRDPRGRVISINFVTVLPEDYEVDSEFKGTNPAIPIQYHRGTTGSYELLLKQKSIMFDSYSAEQQYSELQEYYKEPQKEKSLYDFENSIAFDHVLLIKESLNWIKKEVMSGDPIFLGFLNRKFTIREARDLLKHTDFARPSYYQSTGSFMAKYAPYLTKVGVVENGNFHGRKEHNGQFIYSRQLRKLGNLSPR